MQPDEMSLSSLPGQARRSARRSWAGAGRSRWMDSGASQSTQTMSSSPLSLSPGWDAKRPTGVVRSAMARLAGARRLMSGSAKSGAIQKAEKSYAKTNHTGWATFRQIVEREIPNCSAMVATTLQFDTWIK